MFELEHTEQIKRLIEITKSNSGISGPELAKAHIELGRLLSAYLPVEPMDTTVVAMMRGGIFFAQGIYFGLGCKFQLFDPIKPILDSDTLIASCVINEKAVPFFQDQLYTVRVSNNSFVGSNIKKQEGGKGPDTTMRLFNLI